MGKRIFLAGLAFLLLLPLSGCNDQTEVSDELYAIMLGVDQGEQGGIRLTLALPVYGSSTGEGQQEGEESKIYSAEADNVFEGLNQLHLQVAREISLLHLKLVVFSEELAREGIADHAAAVRHHIETRNVMGVMVTSGTAEEYISHLKEDTAGTLSQELEKLLFRSRNNIYFPVRTFEEFCRDMESDYGQTYAVYRKSPEEDEEQYGTALFRKGKMVGDLDKIQSACTMMVRGEFTGGTMEIDGATVDINGRPRAGIRIQCNGQRPKIQLHLRVQGGFMEENDPAKKTELQQKTARGLEEYMKQAIRKTQSCGSDIWGFGRSAASCFATIPRWEAYHWNQRFSQAEVEVKVTFQNVKIEVNQR